MKLKNIFASLLCVLLAAVGCQQEQEFGVLDGLSVSQSYIGLPTEGGSVEVTVKADDKWEISAPRWVTVSPKSGDAGETVVTFSVLETKKLRTGEAEIKSGSLVQSIEFVQYYKEASSGPRTFVKTDKVTSGRAYMIVFSNGTDYLALEPNTDPSSTYKYNTVKNVASALSEDKTTITLDHQDYSFIFKVEDNGVTIRQMADGRYIGNESGYQTISVAAEDVKGPFWKFQPDGEFMKVMNGESWMQYSTQYTSVGVYSSAQDGALMPCIYEDTQEPALDELAWNSVAVSNVTKTTATLSATFVYNGFEPLDDAGFIVESKDTTMKFSVGEPTESTFTYNIGEETKTSLKKGTEYSVVAYLDYEGMVSKSDPVAFTTKDDVPDTLTVAQLVAGIEEVGVGAMAQLGDYLEGIVTAVDGENGNVNGLIVEDGTGEPGSGIYFYGSKYKNLFKAGDKVILPLAAATAKIYNNLLEVTDGELSLVSSGNKYTSAEITADEISDYVNMYVTVKNVKPNVEKGTVWADGSSSNGYVEFIAVDGDDTFDVKTYKSCPWAKEAVGVNAKGNVSGVVTVNNKDYSVLPNSAEDIKDFKSTDPQITLTSPSSLSWEGHLTDSKVVTVSGDRLGTIAASADSDHFIVSVTGYEVTVTPKEVNSADDAVKAVLTIYAIDGNKVEVALTHNPAAKLPEFTAGAYWIVADGKAALPLTKNYGYLSAQAGGDSSQANLFTFTAVEGGFTIQDPSGKYYYQKGTYDSFNVSDSAPAEGHVWTVEPQYDGTFKITNVLVSKYIQLDSQYGTYGSYNSVKGSLPVLVKGEAAPVPPAASETVASVVMADLGYANAESVDGVKIKVDDNVTLVFNQGNASTAPAYYNSGSAIRMYQNGATLDVNAGGKTITAIEITFANNHFYVAADSGSLSDEAAVRTWTGEASNVKFTSTGTDKNHRAYVSAIKVTYK